MQRADEGIFRAVKLITYAISTGCGAALLATVPTLDGPTKVGVLVGGVFLAIAPWIEFLEIVHVVPVTVAQIIADWKDGLDEHAMTKEIEELKHNLLEVIEAYERERIRANRLDEQVFALSKRQSSTQRAQPQPQELSPKDVFSQESERIDRSVMEFMRAGDVKPEGNGAHFDAESERYKDAMEILDAYESIQSFARRKLHPATTMTEPRFRDAMKVLEDAGAVVRDARGAFEPTSDDLDELTELVAVHLGMG